MSYHLTYRASFRKELRKLQPTIRKAVTKRILSLSNNPRPDGCSKLAGTDDLYRIRQGDYRLIYGVYDDLVIVELIKIGHRSDVYRKR